MDFTFSTTLKALGPNAAFDLANRARPSASYLLNTILPERAKESYDVERATMTVRSTMAGVVAMDSPYPQGGYITADSFKESVFKVANEVTFPEAGMRTLQAMMARLGVNGSAQQVTQEVTNFFQKVILQPHDDMAEWLRGQALTKGALDFKFNGKHVSVDYGVPAGNKFATRTGNDAYSGSTSKWWDDVRAAQKILRGGLVKILTNGDTANEIIYNPANNVRLLEQGEGFFKIGRLENENGVVRPSEDARDVVTLVIYNEEGDLASPATNGIENVKFIEDGYVVFIGRNQVRGYEVGQGSTKDPDNDLELGYTHLGPTVEGGGRPGRWGKLWVPDGKEYQLTGAAVANLMPVIMAPKKLVIAHTAMAA